MYESGSQVADEAEAWLISLAPYVDYLLHIYEAEPWGVPPGEKIPEDASDYVDAWIHHATKGT
jgi:hypothetical protein